MTIEIVSWIAVGIILIASTGLLISRDWRWSLSLLAIQYLAAFGLVIRHWPIGMASVKLVSGWPRGRWFRIFLAGIVILFTLAAAPRVQVVIPGLGLQVIVGGLLLMGMGLIHLGITTQLLRVILGLLTLLIGFEIIYAALESSILVAGLIAVVNLGLALAGSYLLVASSSAEGTE
jgi:hypothetical protein